MSWAAAELLECAQAAESRGAWRTAVLELVRRYLPWEDSFWGMPPASCDREAQVYLVAEPKSHSWSSFIAAPEVYRLPLAMQRTWRAGGVGIDTDILNSRQIDRARIYAEILRPAGVRTTMTVMPSFRGVPTSCIGFARHGTSARFREREGVQMLEVARALGVVEMAFRARHASDSDISGGPLLELLTRRERQVAGWVVQGFSNKEIAALLGTTVNTVRKQVAAVYSKLRARGRMHLAQLLRA